MTADDIQQLATLSRIELAPAEAETLAGEFDTILGYVAQVEAEASEAAAPVAGVHANILRDDTLPERADAHTEALLAAAPVREGRYIRVKKVLS